MRDGSAAAPRANTEWHEAGVLALVPDDWSAAWQRRHQILSRLADYCPVAWISPALHWQAWLRTRTHRRVNGQRHRAPGPRMFALASADGIPTVHEPRALRRAVFRQRVSRGVRWLRHRGCRAIEVQLWLPEFADALDWVSYTTSSYHIDDEYSWSAVDVPLSVEERRVIERVDRVYVTSPKLLDAKGGINPNTIFSPNGVDYRAYSTPGAEPSDLARIPHPRVAYVGVLKEQLDWGLITALATVHAAWSFVFVGPIRTVHESLPSLLASLGRLPNVHLLGERTVESLPGYFQAVDVALLPYLRNAYADSINPLKLYEALAAGTPIVASPIRTLRDFTSVVTLAEGVDEWSAGIADALTDESTSFARRTDRQAVARAHDWDAIVASMAVSMAEGLGAKRV